MECGEFLGEEYSPHLRSISVCSGDRLAKKKAQRLPVISAWKLVHYVALLADRYERGRRRNPPEVNDATLRALVNMCRAMNLYLD